MKFHYLSEISNHSNTIIIPFLESENTVVYQNFSINTQLFSGKKDEIYTIFKEDKKVIFLGLGKEINYKTIQNVYRRLITQKQNIFSDEFSLVFPDFSTNIMVESAISGLFLGTYQIGHFKFEKKKNTILNPDFCIHIVSSKDLKNDVIRGLAIGKATYTALEMIDLPPNVVTPTYLADWAKTLEDEQTIVKIFDQETCEKLDLNLFVNVGKGSEQPMKFIIIDYKPTNYQKHFGLIGKGITFDTGGYNIKTQGMLHMKCDMGGAASVFGAIALIKSLKIKQRVTVIVPACENSISGKSLLPSEVISSYSGKSIEIIDTDAEGRLILADAISYMIKNYMPETLIDVATLTGSSVGTFGNECAALFSNNQEIVSKLGKLGEEINEKNWQLPLWECYKSDIESEIADVKNYSGKPISGAISAAKFLEYFTENHPAWAHLDIAGVAFVDGEFAKTKYASGYGVYLLTKFIENN
jgi:leucyl aminopeptidase